MNKGQDRRDDNKQNLQNKISGSSPKDFSWMSERTGDGYVALLLTCAIALIGIGFVSYTFAVSKGKQSADQEHTAYYAQRDATEIAYAKCLDGTTSIDLARECIAKSGTPIASPSAQNKI